MCIRDSANIEEHDLPGAVRRAAGAGRLGYVHIGESHRGYLGTGSVAWDTFFDVLAEVRYRGPVVFESFSSVVVSQRFAAALAIWRDLWDDSTDLAVHAHSFIADHLARRREEHPCERSPSRSPPQGSRCPWWTRSPRSSRSRSG